jgi:hypothetical protein
MCWSTRAGFKTSREEAFGLGQWTVVYGRFDKFKETKTQFKTELNGWDDKYDVNKQSLALVLMNKYEWGRVGKLSPSSDTDHTAMTLVAHNGGFFSIIQDKKLCTPDKKCDNSKWFNNIEKYSFKSKVKLKGYGQSFFEISRNYPRDIMFVRREKYKFLDSQTPR